MRRTTVPSLLMCALLAALVGTGCGNNNPTPQTPRPSPVTFQLRNDATTALFLHQSCTLDVTIKSVTDPTLTFDMGGGCFCACDFDCGPIACGACLEAAMTVPPVGTVLYSWTPMIITFEPRGSFQCARTRVAPAGSYRIDVNVFPTEADATAKTNGRIASQTFTLPVETAVPVTLFTPP